MDNHAASQAESRFVRLHDLLVNPRYVETLHRAGLATLDGLFAVAKAELLSKPGLDGWRQRLRLTIDDNGRSQTLYIKRFDHPPSKAQRAVRRSGSRATSVAGVEWTWLTRLAAAGIPCPEPVAFGEERSSRKECRSALVMAAVPGSSLEQLATRWSNQDRTSIRAALIETAQLVRRLHALGYVHRDLYLAHLFFDDSHASARPSEASVHLIDLQRVFAPTWGLHRWIVKDLAALNYSTPKELVSTKDRVRWLKRYLDVSKLDSPARRLVYKVVGKTHRIERHDRRRTAKHHRLLL